MTSLSYADDINSSVNSAKKSKLIKKKLNLAYPDVKFSVTCEKYSGGFSFNIRWVNGPKTSDIDPLLNEFHYKNRADYMEHDYCLPFYVFSNRVITDEVWKWAEKQIEAITGAPYNDYEDHTKRNNLVFNTDLRGLFN